MLTLEDCIALSELNEDEIAAISEHEHIPEIVAVEYGNYLLRTADGVPMLNRIILDDIEAAKRRGDLKHALHLRLVLRRFVLTHRELRSAAN